MTAKKDLKKRVRERAARTGESYTTAREHVIGKTGPSGGLVVETRDLSEQAARVGIRCPVSMFPELARRVDGSAVLARVRDVLRATEGDPGTELLRAVVLRGEQPEPPPMPIWMGEAEKDFVARACAGIGGVSESGTMLALPVAGRKGFEMVVCQIALSPSRTEAAVRELFDEIGRSAPSSGHFLISGDSRRDRDLVARAIHDRSRRASGPFIKLNCAAIPAELIESQLFGHEKGAFAGATRQRRGAFELAAGGTLFLDEVGHMPQGAQAGVLGILREGKLERLGGERSIVVTDIRVVAASKNLAAEVAAGRFRADLYDRLNNIPINLPALRAYRPASLLLLGRDDFPLFVVDPSRARSP